MPWKPASSGDRPREKDFWDKADVLAKFLSSVVIAAVGLLITMSIQRQQTATTKAIADAQLLDSKTKEETEKRLEEGKLSVELLDHLTSKDPAQRKLAVIAFKHSLPAATYDEVVGVLAETDGSSDVQLAAIAQLSTSQRPQVSHTLATISRNDKQPTTVRNAADTAFEKVNFSGLGSGATYVFGASKFNGVAYERDELQGGVFTHFLVKGLSGDADVDKDGIVTADELAQYLVREVPSYTQHQSLTSQEPFFYFSGDAGERAPLINPRPPAPVFALVIGVSHYRNGLLPTLRWSIHDAEAMEALLKKNGAEVTTLRDPNFVDVLSAIDTLAERSTPECTLVLYFSGASYISDAGEAGWALADFDSRRAYSYLTLDQVKHQLSRARARRVILFIDTAYAEGGGGSKPL
jgi:hypothetical protein